MLISHANCVCFPRSSFSPYVDLEWTYLGKRNESPSPQRRPARERYNSRSYTPEEASSSVSGKVLHLITFLDFFSHPNSLNEKSANRKI